MDHRSDSEVGPGAAVLPGPSRTEERKQRVLTHGTPSITRTIADAVVIKDGDLFLLVESDGRVPRRADHGLGLYYDDCRFLRTYEITFNGARPVSLGSTSAPGYCATFELTNPDLQLPDGGKIQKEALGIRWEHRVSGGEPALFDEITIQNWSQERIRLPVELRFDAQFEDVFEVRGLLDERLGSRDPPEWHEGRLEFGYLGSDRRRRTLVVSFPGEVEQTGQTTATVWVNLEPRASRCFSIRLAVGESEASGEKSRVTQPRRTSAHVPEQPRPEVRSNSAVLNGVLDRSFGDLQLLTSEIEGETFFAAGLPWFATLFGRDSIISALQVLAYEPRIAEHTLRLLARFQGERVDDWRDEQPGKMLHELRVGELARAGEIPHTPYYGSIDATPLFLILLAEHARWTGDLTLFHELKPQVERALDWIARYGDSDGDGYVEYRSSSRYGLINQGWKDSGNAIIGSDGKLAVPPIALVEVPGYVYAAKIAIADLYRRTGHAARSAQLNAEAGNLRINFNQDYWLEDRDCYALALEADKRPLDVVSSNPGQALWSGIADPEKAARTAKRLLADDMFSGWGMRTLSTDECGYNPIGYHLGTVWPHDNSIIAAGFKRYGHDDGARRIFDGIVEAAMHFTHRRLPELFTGFSRKEFETPIRYPVACHPQAWAAGAVPFMTQVLLGLSPDGFAKRLRLVRPLLPAGVDDLELNAIRIGGDTVSLRFKRNQNGAVAVETLGASKVEVVVEATNDGQTGKRGSEDG